MAKNEHDRRVQRTRQALREALLELMSKQGFEATTVQDIIERANVGRSTFYAHYQDKEDLLVQGLGELREWLGAQRRLKAVVPAEREERLFAFGHELFAHAHQNRNVFRAVAGKESGAVVQRYFQELLEELIWDEVKATLPRTAQVPQLANAVVHYLAGGLMGLLSWWMDAKTALSVEEVDRLFKRLAVPVVRAASLW